MVTIWNNLFGRILVYDLLIFLVDGVTRPPLFADQSDLLPIDW